VLAEIPTERGADTSPIGRWSSIAAHSILLVLLILAGRHAWQVRPVSTRGGQHSTVLYWASSVGTGVAHSHQQGAEKLPPARVIPRNNPVNPSHQKMLDPETPQATETAAASPAGSSTSPSQNEGTGDGSENMTPAFPVYSPSPHVADRSLLPLTNENVVVDVNVSALGEVLDEKLVHGLGNSLDQTILDTVRSWKFHPATVDGNAVASVAELVFPLSQKWRG
jgi:TonB family protein